jgi:Predicted nucleic acid-binding protein, contains PIN domain
VSTALPGSATHFLAEPGRALRQPSLWVLDTNVVLDWLLFGDVSMQAPCGLLLAGGACWIATAAMRDEALEVATRPVFAKRGAALDLRHRVAAGFARHAQMQADGPPGDAAAPTLRCSDPDDQMFIELALRHSAELLLTRDLALLALAPAARARGLRIMRPKDFAAEAAAHGP